MTQREPRSELSFAAAFNTDDAVDYAIKTLIPPQRAHECTNITAPVPVMKQVRLGYRPKVDASRVNRAAASTVLASAESGKIRQAFGASSCFTTICEKTVSRFLLALTGRGRHRKRHRRNRGYTYWHDLLQPSTCMSRQLLCPGGRASR